MSKRNRIIALFTAAVMLLTSVSVSFAWFAKLNSADLDENGGSVVTRYFHKGDGTAENPYEITRPVHFYNLVMLYQANPAVKGSDFITASTHFRIGTKDLDLDGIDELKEFSVFEYDDSGVTNNNTSQTLNLASYTDGLFPIGSAEKPFQATLDGENITIKNLKIVGSTSLNGTTYTTPDIGLFGYVSNKDGNTEQTPTIKNLYIDSMTIDLTNVDISGKNLNTSTTVTHDPTKHTDHAAYVGYIAGHIITGAQVNDVYVNNCTVTGGNEAYSGFGFFGCVEDKDGNIVTTLGQEIITQRTKGDNAGFGGSVDMKQMHDRLTSIAALYDSKNPTTSPTIKPTQYYSIENIVIDENNNTRVVSRDGLTNVNPRDNVQYLYYTTANKYAGEYYYINDSNGRYMCMYGDSSRMPKTVNTYTISTEDLDAFYISDGGVYLKAVKGGITNSDKSGASKWSFDESGHLFAYINNETYYLNRNGLSGVAVSQSASTVWSRNDQSALYTNISGIDYFLYYSAGWRLSSLTQYYYISDNNGHFLSAQPKGTSGLTVINTDSADSSVKWQIDISGNEYTFFTDVSDTNYYLALDTKGALVMSTAKSSWILEDGYFTKTVSSGSLSTKYRLVYDGGWKVSEIGKLITDGNGHFLSCSTTSVTNSTQENAVVWQTTVGANGNTQFYTFINSVPYYISFNSGLTVSETPFNWKKDGNSYYYTSNGRDYYIRYNNGWEAVTLEYKLITDGNGNYLKADGNNSFSNATADNATRFYFSNSDSGNITYNFNNSQYYLGVSNGSFADTATNWSFTADGCLRADNTYYYLVYDGGWKIALPKYTISSGNNYLSIDSSGNIINETNQANAAKWTFSNPSTYSGTISTVINGTTKYLSVSRSRNWYGSYSYTLNTSNNSGENWLNNGNKLYVNKNSGWGQNANFYITTNNSWKDLNTTGTTLTFTPIFEHVAAEARSDNLPEIAVQEKVVPSPNVNISNPITVDYSLDFEKTTQKRITKETKTNVIGGYQSYFPLRIADENENGWYDAADPFKVSQKNTGYIISGARLEDSTATDDGQKAYGDIRISYFSISSVSGSYDTEDPEAFKTIYTVDGNGKHSYTANSPAYQTASKQLLDTLDGSTSVYGLHFMDAKISKDYLVTAEKAVVLGKEYDNYEMPMDSIDFNVIERGSINFFAGDYFTGNNSFFSLHQVFRDENNKITDIKEIEEIYEHKEKGSAVSYVYKFKDNTYSADVDISDYKSVFKTEWIKNPGFNRKGNNIYYFEIPCNKGEYCLGSVSGKTGAYLIYLDIAANGGEAIKKVISSEGNAVTNAFKTEYRTAPARLGENNYSVLLFSTTAPQGTNQNNFSVNLSFKKMDSNDPDYSSDYANGVYIITVTNKSNSDIQLDVFLCDDDRDITNDFLYAYKVVYNNSDHTGAAVPTVLNSNYWQAMARFKIPPTGEAGEISYKS